MARTVFRILGPLEVASGDRDVAIRGRRQRALLALLLLRANEVVPSERLLADLWGEEVPESGLAALHVRISQLRRALDVEGSGTGSIVTRGPGYLLTAHSDAIDSRRFERQLSEGRALLGEGAAGEAAERLSDALALWRGPALADFRYEAFAQGEIARLEELRLVCLERRIEADLALGRHRDVAAELEALVAAHPLREGLRGQLMLALYRSGRQSDALTAYRDARETLVGTLGIEPGNDLRRLEQAILRHDPALSPPPHPNVPAARRRATSEERKLVTALFADIVASTRLVTSHDPERARLLLDRFAETMGAEIEAAGGTLEKFVGDAIMAVFGAPRAHEDHAERALHAALAMRRRLEEVFGDDLAIRVGVATGEVVVGSARAGGSFATGVAINAGARLAQVAAPGEILVAARTVRAASAFEFGPTTVVEAEGFPEGIECRTLVRALALTRPRRVGGREMPLVGRERELEVLRAAYRRVAATRRPALVTVVGDAGVGKSRLARELWAWLAAQSPEPLRRTSRCHAVGRSIGSGPLRDVLLEELGLLSTDPPDLARSRLGGREILGLALGLEVASDLHPLAARAQLRRAWVEFLEHLVVDRPVVMLFEDVHWAQELLVELIETALREVEGPLLVVATARPELAAEWPAWGRGVGEATSLWLDPLSGDETEVLLEQLLGVDVPAHVRDVLVSRSEGNPFFVEELLASLLDRQVLVRTDAGWQARDVEIDESAPDSVHSVVAARIDLLPPLEKAALQAASVIGRVFWAGAVTELVDGAVPDFATLEARDLVRQRPLSSRANERELAFKHALTRDVAYASLPKASRARLHARYAAWLERTGGGRDEDAPFLAHHYAEAVRAENRDLAWADGGDEEARVRAKALTWLRRSAELAIGRYEIDTGLALLERALELEDRDVERSLIWHAIGRANAVKHDGRPFWNAMARAIETAPDGAAQAELYSELAYETCDRWGMLRSSEDMSAVAGWIERALELAPRGSAARARALAALVWTHPDETQAAREALEIAERLDEPSILYAALEAQRVVAFANLDFEAAVAWDRRRLELVPRLPDPDARADVLLTAAPSFVAGGRMEEARSLARTHDELTAPLTPHHRVHGVALLVEVEEAAGEWAAVNALEQRAVEAIAANAATPCVRNARTLLVCAVAAAYLGDLGRAQRLAADADAAGLEHFHEILDGPRLRLALATGDTPTAGRLLETFRRPAREWLRRGRAMGLTSIATLLDALVLLGHRDDVEREAPPLLRPGTYLEPFALRALGAAREDVDLVERAVAAFEALGLAWFAEETRRLLATAAPRLQAR